MTREQVCAKPEEEESPDPLEAQFRQEHLEFLKNHRPDMLAALEKSGDLEEHLSTLAEQATSRFWAMMGQFQHSPKVQSLPFQEQVTALQHAEQEAEEIIRHEMIYQPLPEEATQPYLDEQQNAPMPRYRVMVDDNFDYQDSDARCEHGIYETVEEALVVCRRLVDLSLKGLYKPGTAAEALYRDYVRFGDDPFIEVIDGANDGPIFSAWSYAEERCRVICGCVG